MSDPVPRGPAPAAPPASATPPAQRRLGARRVRVLGASTGALVVLVVAGLVLWLPNRSSGDTTAAGDSIAWERPVAGAAGLAERSGVKLTQVAVTGAGGLIDVRYQVLDPDKANSLHAKQTPPALVDERSGLVVNELLMNHAVHKGPLKIGVTYYLVFSNPGNWVRRGSMVTVLLGNAQVQHVVVR
jgi:hypothetical protein